MATTYTAIAVSSGNGRDGHVESSDGLLSLDLAIPKEMGGSGGKTNPEQLFAAGYSACFHSALRFLARQSKIDVDSATVTAEVGIGPNGSGGFGLSVALRIELMGIDQGIADELVAKAHQTCPYSNATRGNVEVTLETVVA